MSFTNHTCLLVSFFTMNFIGANIKSNLKLQLNRRRAKIMLEMAKADSDFLAEMNILDYSLLIGVTNIQFAIDHTKKRASGENLFEYLHFFFLFLLTVNCSLLISKHGYLVYLKLLHMVL